MQFQSPKNFKRGRLVANKYRPVDLFLAVLLTIISIASVLTYLLSYNGKRALVITLLLFPAGIGLTLIIPFAVYHNFLELIHLALKHYLTRRKWKWEGVYYYDSRQTENDEA